MGVVKHKTISSSAIGPSGVQWRKLRTTFGYGVYFLISIICTYIGLVRMTRRLFKICCLTHNAPQKGQ
jgi:hypothetical protein